MSTQVVNVGTTDWPSARFERVPRSLRRSARRSVLPMCRMNGHLIAGKRPSMALVFVARCRLQVTHPTSDHAFLQWPFSVEERREMDSMQCSDGLDFLDPLARDEPSPLGERLETSRQGQGHAFE